VIFLSALVLAFQASTPQPAPTDFVQAWTKVADAIHGAYYARNSRSNEMDERLKHYAPLAEAAHDKGEFRDIVNRMIGEFKDSHFDLFTDEDQGYYLMDGFSAKPTAMAEVGAWFKKDGDLYRVQMVLDGTAAADAGLRKGDTVMLADGKPFTPIDSLKPDVGKTVDLEISRGNETLHKELKVTSEPVFDMFLDATKDSARIIDDGKKTVGYVHLWTQASPKFSDALANIVYGKFRKTDGVILDLRDGFGGRPEGYGDPFFRPEVNLDWKFPGGDNPELFGYGRPLVVIINGGSRSAKEVLSYVFKKSKRATLVGSNTAGNVLGTSPRRLNEWSIIEIPIVEVLADGIRLEGKGVAPDIAVPKEFDASGKDLYVEAALKVLDKEMK
jgi:carboxyl-terminal processing protease